VKHLTGNWYLLEPRLFPKAQLAIAARFRPLDANGESAKCRFSRARAVSKLPKEILDGEIREFYAHNTERFNRLLEEGSLDGVVLQISCFADISESGLI